MRSPRTSINIGTKDAHIYTERRHNGIGCRRRAEIARCVVHGLRKRRLNGSVDWQTARPRRSRCQKWCAPMIYEDSNRSESLMKTDQFVYWYPMREMLFLSDGLWRSIGACDDAWFYRYSYCFLTSLFFYLPSFFFSLSLSVSIENYHRIK